ncbi:MAG: hypothetical protein KDE47_07230, partial [Caldilineaceae bacterium]|nr:hypothetical protein [Caldilineaceae bacterium]
YPNGETPLTVILTSGVTQTVTLLQPAVEVWVHLAGDAAAKQLVTGYSIGDGPGRIKSHGGPGRLKSHGGSITNGDGAIVLYPPAHLPDTVFFSVQTASIVPPPLAGRRLIGRMFQIQASDPSIDFAGASLTFQYLGADVNAAGQPENRSAVYYWHGGKWQRLRTVLNTNQNFASAPLVGPGIYALMSGYELPITKKGWNSAPYPIDETRPVSVALASLDGYYTIVYDYEDADRADPWKVYGVGVPSWVNDLHALQFGRTYGIYATEAVTWYVEGVPVSAAAETALFPTPPSTFYGVVPPSATFVPTAGMTVTASIDGHVCAQSMTHIAEGQVVYTIDVFAADLNRPSCGQFGRAIVFAIDNHPAVATAVWDNSRIFELPLAIDQPPAAHTLYLPVIAR